MADVRLACPNCGKVSIVDDAVPLPPNAPFCSERCKYGELSKWLDGEYTVSRPVEETDLE